MTAIEPRLLSVDQAAAYLGISKRTMQTYIQERRIRVIRRRRVVRIDRRDLDSWIESNKQ
jgi:excisionase family DNA binding protein